MSYVAQGRSPATHTATDRRSAGLKPCPAPQSLHPYIDVFALGGAELASMSIVIMNPFVPLYS